LKLKKLHQEFDDKKQELKSKVKSKATGKKDEAKELFLKKKKAIKDQYELKMNYLSSYTETKPYM
jgi:hypothetical protein